MALFKRKSNPTIAELEKYYKQQNQPPKKQSRGGWLLGLVFLLLTVFIILGVFFGSRQLYRLAFNRDDSSKVAQQSDDSKTILSEDSQNGQQTDSQDEQNSRADQTKNDEGQVSDQAVNTTESNVDRVDQSEPAPSYTYTEPTDVSGLPQTGPSENILAIILAAGLFGFLSSRKQQLQSSKARK